MFYRHLWFIAREIALAKIYAQCTYARARAIATRLSLSFAISHSHTLSPPHTDRWLNLCIVQSTCYHVLLIWLRRWTQATHIKIHCHTISCAGSLLFPFTCVSVANVRVLQCRVLCVNYYWPRVYGFQRAYESSRDILRFELWDYSKQRTSHRCVYYLFSSSMDVFYVLFAMWECQLLSVLHRKRTRFHRRNIVVSHRTVWPDWLRVNSFFSALFWTNWARFRIHWNLSQTTNNDTCYVICNVYTIEI